MYTHLVKLFLKENFSLKRLLGFDYKTNKVKGVLIGLAILYALVVFFGAIGWMFFDLGGLLDSMNQNDVLLSFFIIYALGLSIIIVFFRANGALFHYKDYHLLAPLPLHPRTILLAKMTILLIMLYASSFIFTLPIAFSYFYWQGLNVLGLLFLLIGFIFMPLVPVVIMSLISLGIAMVSQGFKYNKMIQIILMFAVFIAFFLFSFSINEVDVNPLTGQIDLFAGISRAYPPLRWYIKAVHELSVIHMLYIVLSHGGLFILYILAINPLVQYTNQKGLKSNTKSNGKPVRYQVKPLLWALVQKELKKFFSIPLYAVNAGLGPIILMVLSVASLFYQEEIVALLSEMAGVSLHIEVLIMLLIGFSISMTYTPAISLSLEGNNFWILKSLPVKAETIMFSKIVFNILLIMPIAIISVLLFGISVQIPLLSQLLLIVMVIVFTCLISYLDAFFNLLVPKFNYMNEVEVIKQSAGALLGIFGGFGLMAINGGLYYLVSDMFAFEVIILLMIALNIVILLPLIYVVHQKSASYFLKFQV